MNEIEGQVESPSTQTLLSGNYHIENFRLRPPRLPAPLDQASMIDPGFGHSLEMQISLQIRALRDSDPATISAAFQRIGWKKSEVQYRRYLEEQAAGRRICWVAFVDGQFAGYATLNWQPTYPPFAEAGIPEIQDLNVLPEFQRQGIATRLLDEAEALAGERSSTAGIGVGLHPGYNAAQRLYGKRGYVPDGRGITYHDRFLEEGAQVVVDDELVLHLTKRLRPEHR